MATAPSAARSEPSHGHLHLCSDDKVWAVKQVSTSNSVYVTKTQLLPSQVINSQKQQNNDSNHESNVEDGENILNASNNATGQGRNTAGTDGDAHMTLELDAERAAQNDDQQRPPGRVTPRTDIGSQTGIAAISQVHNVLELVEVKPNDAEIEANIRNIVPVLDDPDHDANEIHLRAPNGGPDANTATVTLREVLDNTPTPTKYVISILKNLFVFILPRRQDERQISATYIPTTHLLLRAWKTFIQQCAISGVKLTTPEGLSGEQLIQDVFRGMIEEAEMKEDGTLTVAVTRAILRQFDLANSDRPDDGGTVSNHHHLDPELDVDLDLHQDLDLVGQPLVLQRDLVSQAVGSWVLLSLRDQQPPSTTVTVAEFLKQWTELLPDSWAEDCDPKALVRTFGAGVGLAKDANSTGAEVLRFTAAATPGSGGGNGASLPKGPVSAVRKDDAGKGQSEAQNHKKRKWHEKFAAQRIKADK
ncbi:hypothetical protein A1O1_02882 [Capronia coronata CBS 617.96]|uniref:Sister chromatid cohesion protein DCC1 n=1 Tax=Capronia coronata CBS 617.96 TaxID=1182541 RepID=W9YYX6_9EURO|nr:uncharacterized protein A1O1_02882 [Capronia coronata CBS 617.96]EXJ94486.1 hypothetical protein A1O1_02882 [Capronia coronata CBS 617.96]